MVSRYDVDESRIVHASMVACLCPLATVDGKHIITVEGLGTAARPHPVQERIALLHGSQCGFCTPGFVMSLYALLRNNPDPTELEIEECFDGNLCRCTGYRPILDAAKTFADQAWKQGSSIAADGTVQVAEPKGCGIEGCCRLQPKSAEQAPGTIVHDPTKAPTSVDTGCCKSSETGGGCCKSSDSGIGRINQAEVEKAAVIAKFQNYDPTQELIFPPFLIRYAKGTTNSDEPQLKPLDIVSNKPAPTLSCKRYLRPLTLPALLAALEQHPGAKLVAGNTRIGMEIRLKQTKFATQVYMSDIPELRRISETADGVTFGGSMSLAR
ncbi:hypothetical protein GGI04_006140, partial [Coemansia thaxteri]